MTEEQLRVMQSQAELGDGEDSFAPDVIALVAEVRRLQASLAGAVTANLNHVPLGQLDLIATLLDELECRMAADFLSGRWDHNSEHDRRAMARVGARPHILAARRLVGPHSGRVDCPCDHPIGTQGPCAGCNCANPTPAAPQPAHNGGNHAE